MNRITAIVLFIVGAIVEATGLVALQSGVKADIPFNFTVGEKSLPASDYIISSAN